MAKIGRPSLYSEELADTICERLVEGESLASICRSEGMPSKWAVFRWLEGNESFRNQYARARDLQAETFADEMTHIADTATEETVQQSRLRIDTRKWIASKLKPKKYGEKLEMEHSGEVKLSPVINFNGSKSD